MSKKLLLLLTISALLLNSCFNISGGDDGDDDYPLQWSVSSISNGSSYYSNEDVNIYINSNKNVIDATIYLDNEKVYQGSSSYNDPIRYKIDMENLAIGTHQLQVTITAPEEESSEKIYFTIRDETTLDGMIFVEGGTFVMGDHHSEGNSIETPLHNVTIDDFYIGKFEVSQYQYQLVMDENPSTTLDPDLPVENIEWTTAIEYCNKLSELEGLEPCYTIDGYNTECDFSKNGYRLPTEAEWEYAARGGKYHSDNFRYSGFNSDSNLENYATASSQRVAHIGFKLPNQLNIHDMSGNIEEWCWDRYGAYSSEDQINPTGADTGQNRVLRGGNWKDTSFSCRVSHRQPAAIFEKGRLWGFRVVRRVL